MVKGWWLATCGCNCSIKEEGVGVLVLVSALVGVEGAPALASSGGYNVQKDWLVSWASDKAA